MNHSKRLWWQLVIVLIHLTMLGILINNLAVNLIRTGLGLSFDWLWRSTILALSEHPVPYQPSDSTAWALLMDWLNSLRVIIAGIVLAIERELKNRLYQYIYLYKLKSNAYIIC